MLRLAFCTIICTASCTQTGTNRQSDSNSSKNDSVRYEVDTSRIAVLPLEEVSHFHIFNNTISTELTLNEYEIIEDLLRECIANYNKNSEPDGSGYDCTIDLSNFKRQYVAVVNSDGDREVWVNCFCRGHDVVNWKKYIVFARDGGNCFFNLKINLTKKQYYDLMVNGYA